MSAVLVGVAVTFACAALFLAILAYRQKKNKNLKIRWISVVVFSSIIGFLAMVVATFIFSGQIDLPFLDKDEELAFHSMA